MLLLTTRFNYPDYESQLQAILERLKESAMRSLIDQYNREMP